ncbi:MAG: leucine-rich repeat protein, partial [Rikenellaceae bacterium]
MKNLFKNGLAACTIALAIASCQKDEAINTSSSIIQEEIEVYFESEISTRATDSGFETGDQISVMAYTSDDSLYRQNVCYTLSDDAIFTSESPIKLEDSDQYLSYKAVYPYMEVSESGAVSFEVQDDQSTYTNYTLSDLMSSSVSSTQSTTPRLTFNHLLTRVIINISTTDVSLDEAVATTYAQRGVDYNIITGSSSAKGSVESITMASNGTNSYKAIITPQNIESNATFAIIEVDGDSYEISFENGKLFYAGMQYTFELEIKNKTIKFISSTINSWDEGDSTSEGDATFSLSEISATSYPDASKKWIITDSIATYDDMAGLRGALAKYNYTTSKVMLEFPNLQSLPEKGLYNQDGFESISMPVATSLGASSLYDCDYMTLVEMDNVLEIGASAFYSCASLTTLSLPLLNTIEEKAFYQCTSIVELSLPSAESVGTYAFYGCTKLTSLSLENVSEVGTYAFSGCSALTSLTMATTSQLTIFGDNSVNVFGSLDLSQITLTVGASVNVSSKALLAPIDGGGMVVYSSFAAINGGNQIEDITPTTLSEFSATNYPIYSDEWTITDTEAPLAMFIGLNDALNVLEGTGRKISLTFPNLDRIPSTAFYIGSEAISSIVSFSAPKATEVGNSAFRGCSSLANLYLPLVDSLGSSAFYNCDALTQVSLPLAESIGSYAFYDCNA